MAAYGGLLCAGCEADTFGARQKRSLCLKCGADVLSLESCVCAQPNELDAVVCAIDYQFTGQLLIQMYKEGKQLALASLLGDMMVRAAQPVVDRFQPDAWVPIPASKARLLRTGYSPAQQLARAVAKATSTPSRLDWLRLIRDGVPQKTLNRFERARSVRGQFGANRAVSGRCIGLIDDVVTTTSTAAEAARTLKAAGASQVFLLAAARTPWRA